MDFFDAKEDVLDVKLTRYGKDLLSRGKFKPVYYQFFDDDILYNSANAGFQEHQNATENRILNETPKLKTTPSKSGLQTKNIIQKDPHKYPSGFSEESSISALMELDDERLIKQAEYYNSNFISDRFQYDRAKQTRILLYSLENQETHISRPPSFNVTPLDSKFSGSLYYEFHTSSGIIKNIPQLTINPQYYIIKDSTSYEESQIINSESHFDLTSEKVTFADKTTLSLEKRDIVLDIEEINSFFNLENFVLEIFEVSNNSDQEEVLTKIETIEEIRDLFEIKTDQSVNKEGVVYKSSRQRNYKNTEREDL